MSQHQDTANTSGPPRRFAVDIAGSYGDEAGSIHLLVDGREVVMWDSAEWIEDPSVVFVIAEAIRRGAQDPDSLAAALGHDLGSTP